MQKKKNVEMKGLKHCHKRWEGGLPSWALKNERVGGSIYLILQSTAACRHMIVEGGGSSKLL